MIEIGSEFSLFSNKDSFFKKLLLLGKSSILMRSGRDSLGFLANLLQSRSSIILIPAYCCDSMVQPFLVNGWGVEYYPINEDFSICHERLIDLCFKLNPDVVLVINYFGLVDTRGNVDLMKSLFPNIIIIEDITQVFFDIEKLFNTNVDFYIGSLRKWLGVPDGGIIISNKINLPELKYVKNEFVKVRKISLNIKAHYLIDFNIDLKKKYLKFFKAAELLLDNGKQPHSISSFSRSILFNLNVQKLTYSRKRNASYLCSLLNKLSSVKILLPNNQGINVPLYLPILVNNRDMVQQKLSSFGIYAPVLWPLSVKSRDVSIHAFNFEKKLLAIPIDQRYDILDMDYIYKALKMIIKENG